MLAVLALSVASILRLELFHASVANIFSLKSVCHNFVFHYNISDVKPKFLNSGILLQIFLMQIQQTLVFQIKTTSVLDLTAPL